MLTVNLRMPTETTWMRDSGRRAGPPAPIPRLVRSTATVCQAGCPCQTTARLGSNSTMISHHTNSFHESLKSHLLVSNFPQHDRIGRAGAKLPLLDRYAHAWMWAHGGWEVRPASTAVPRGHAGLRAPRDPMLPGLQPVRREPSR